MEIITIETRSLGDRSYVVTDGAHAAVIDPQRDIDRLLAALEPRGLRVTHVFETHIHNDYVSGGLELARRAGAQLVVPSGEDVSFDAVHAADGDVFAVGRLLVRAVHTPGHTPTHLSYAVKEAGERASGVVFTGGSMLYGTVGRTDLISADFTETLSRAQFQSVRRLAAQLDGDTAVYPTHGFGSFCSSSAGSSATVSTVAAERTANIALTVEDEDAFVAKLLAGLDAYPRYYAHMGPANRRGPAPVDLSPPTPVDPVEVRRRIHAGDWVVDLRARRAFARHHLAGTINVEIGDLFVTYLGWLVPWTTPITLIGDTAEEIVEAQRQMVRIGIDRPAGAADGGVEAWGQGGDVRAYRLVTFDELAAADAQAGRGETPMVILDVRRHDERAQGSVAGSLHIPLHELDERMSEVPPGVEVWVHCGSGFRAALAGSLLERAGHRVVVVDDDWPPAAGAHTAPAQVPEASTRSGYELVTESVVSE